MASGFNYNGVEIPCTTDGDKLRLDADALCEALNLELRPHKMAAGSEVLDYVFMCKDKELACGFTKKFIAFIVIITTVNLLGSAN